MKTLLTLLVLLFSSSLFSKEWNLETLDALNDGCLEGQKNRSLKESYKWCACTIFRTYKYFTLNEILNLYENGTLGTNKKYKRVLDECD